MLTSPDQCSLPPDGSCKTPKFGWDRLSRYAGLQQHQTISRKFLETQTTNRHATITVEAICYLTEVKTKYGFSSPNLVFLAAFLKMIECFLHHNWSNSKSFSTLAEFSLTSLWFRLLFSKYSPPVLTKWQSQKLTLSPSTCFLTMP